MPDEGCWEEGTTFCGLYNVPLSVSCTRLGKIRSSRAEVANYRHRSFPELLAEAVFRPGRPSRVQARPQAEPRGAGRQTLTPRPGRPLREVSNALAPQHIRTAGGRAEARPGEARGQGAGCRGRDFLPSGKLSHLCPVARQTRDPGQEDRLVCAVPPTTLPGQPHTGLLLLQKVVRGLRPGGLSHCRGSVSVSTVSDATNLAARRSKSRSPGTTVLTPHPRARAPARCGWPWRRPCGPMSAPFQCPRALRPRGQSPPGSRRPRGRGSCPQVAHSAPMAPAHLGARIRVEIGARSPLLPLRGSPAPPAAALVSAEPLTSGLGRS